VRAWIEDLPEWVKVLTAPESDDPILGKLDPGERAAIALGLSLKADLTLIDERKGTAAALTKGFEVTGTLGVLDLAATRGLVNLRDALDRLTRTNFRYRPELIAALLTKHRG
jgi:predicted nucleic acid-binding protein